MTEAMGMVLSAVDCPQLGGQAQRDRVDPSGVGDVVRNAATAAAQYIVRNMKMEHRPVVLPDLQGLSIGARMSEWVAQHVADQGYRYRSVTRRRCRRSPRS
ncbi:hypothetical protein [Nonomuraea sp. NPDC049480]|uniref:hypothetical protein n=1 Tax=Nonomuraea sp. NPDC049480 TaxID=3364353 RepID=UPI0037A4C16B